MINFGWVIILIAIAAELKFLGFYFLIVIIIVLF